MFGFSNFKVDLLFFHRISIGNRRQSHVKHPEWDCADRGLNQPVRGCFWRLCRYRGVQSHLAGWLEADKTDFLLLHITGKDMMKIKAAAGVLPVKLLWFTDKSYVRIPVISLTCWKAWRASFTTIYTVLRNLKHPSKANTIHRPLLQSGFMDLVKTYWLCLQNGRSDRRERAAPH